LERLVEIQGEVLRAAGEELAAEREARLAQRNAATAVSDGMVSSVGSAVVMHPRRVTSDDPTNSG
jgi:hypothetical protein